MTDDEIADCVVAAIKCLPSKGFTEPHMAAAFMTTMSEYKMTQIQMAQVMHRVLDMIKGYK